MTTHDADPARGWQAAREFYIEFADEPTWDFLRQMAGLVEWVARQPMAARLYPGTSHLWLTVGLSPGYHPELPFLAVCCDRDGQLRCELYKAVGKRLIAREYPIEKTNEGFAEFVAFLEALPGKRQ